jgi:hypothetical protein
MRNWRTGHCALAHIAIECDVVDGRVPGDRSRAAKDIDIDLVGTELRGPARPPCSRTILATRAPPAAICRRCPTWIRPQHLWGPESQSSTLDSVGESVHVATPPKEQQMRIQINRCKFSVPGCPRPNNDVSRGSPQRFALPIERGAA